MSSPDPVLLRADNFTPPARTPWGGRRIAGTLKAAWLPPEAANQRVGESWELSVEPDFPARLDGCDTPLLQWLRQAPAARLGDEHRRGRDGTALLVKLLDAEDNLSVQIHPADDSPRLRAGQAGKPECWYILHAEPGAGLYLGFTPGADEACVRAALRRGGGALRDALRFVPVRPGDFFLIEAGMPHAIGAGLTLVEPQHVLPGKRGVTYRYWDWDRRYDERGALSDAGAPRPLHVEDALAVTRWELATAPDLLSRVRVRAGAAAVAGPAQRVALCGPDAPRPSAFLRAARLAGCGALELPACATLQALTVLEGHVTVGSLQVPAGRTAALPPGPARALALHHAHAVVASVA